MECPHCHQEIIGKTCDQCGKSIPMESRYCLFCGEEINEPTSVSGSPATGDPFDLENRILCPDGTCTGIIVDGICTECGKHYKEVAAEEEKQEEKQEEEEQDNAKE